jgi:hypothetical protein
MSIEIVCCENMLITCFAFCLEMWNVIWKMRFRFVSCKNCLKWFVLVIMLDHLIVIFFWSFNFTFWRMTHAHSSFSIIKWRMFVLDLSSDVYDETSSLTKHLIKLVMRRLIKLDENDSSNLTRTTHQTWRKRLIRLDERNVISLNLTKASSHQTWRKRHLIKLDENVISSNLTKVLSHQTLRKKSYFFIFW